MEEHFLHIDNGIMKKSPSLDIPGSIKKASGAFENAADYHNNRDGYH